MTPDDPLLAAAIAACTGPTQVYDLGRIERTFRMLGAALGDPARVLVAVKAFPSPEVLALAAACGTGFEVSSPLEYALLPDDLAGRTVALNAPIPGDLTAYLSRGNRLDVHLDGAGQVDGLAVPPRTRLALRVSHTALGADDAKPGERRSRFGVTPAELRAAAPLFRSGRLTGVHVHSGSEANTPAFLRSALERILAAAAAMGVTLGFVDLGGGLHFIPDAELVPLLTELRAMAGPTELCIEPGRVVAREAGHLLTRVLAVREVEDGRWKATLDSSYECHAKWSRLQWRAPTALDARKEPYDSVPPVEPGRAVLHLTGASCIELDIMGIHTITRTDGPPVAVGDVLVFDNLDGYAYAWNAAFNGIPAATVRFL